VPIPRSPILGRSSDGPPGTRFAEDLVRELVGAASDRERARYLCHVTPIVADVAVPSTYGAIAARIDRLTIPPGGR